MAYREQIEITPSTITNLTVVVKDDTFFTTLTLDDFTLSDNILTGSLTVSNNNAPISIYSQGYEPIITTFGDLSNSITLTPTSDYIKTSDGTNNYYVKDSYSRQFGNDLLDIVMTKADSSDIPDVSNFVTNTSLATTLNDYQPLLESGTNIKTINNTSLLGSGNIDTREIYTAVFDESTFTDVQNAYNSGKIIKCDFLGNTGFVTCYLVLYEGDYFVFMGENRYREVDNIQYIFLRLDSNDNWIYWQKENADTTLSNVSSINSNSAVATALDGKVSKSGDTMTGTLNIANQGYLAFQHSELTKGTIPSATTYQEILFEDGSNADTWEEKRLGYIQSKQYANGRSSIVMGAIQNVANSSNAAIIETWIEQDGTMHCTFPNTECVDSKVYNTSNILLNNGNLSVAEHSYSLSSYLPNDGKVYEIFLEIRGRTGTASGNYALIWADGGITGCNLVYTTTRSSNFTTFCGYGSIYVSSARNLNIKLSGNAITNTTIAIRGYRRIGTNE